MPRVGIGPESQTAGGQFSFPEGRGRVINSIIANHAIPGFATDCGYLITIQGLSPDGTHTVNEPIEEFLKCGSVEKFHPGKADGPDDQDPQLEINGAKDMGVDESAQGNCLLSVSGAGPDRKSKAAMFANSAIEQGVKKEMFDGWGARLIGMEAHFTQFMMEKPANSTSKNTPTCLIIGRGGKPVPAEKLVFKYPDGTGVATLGAAGTGGSARPTPTATTSAPRSTPPPPPTATPAAHVNGAPAPTTDDPVAAPAPSASVEGEPDDVIARQILDLIGKEIAGKPGLTRKKIASRMMSKLASARVPAGRHTAVTALVKTDDAWFNDYAESVDWAVAGTGETATVTVPAF